MKNNIFVCLICGIITVKGLNQNFNNDSLEFSSFGYKSYQLLFRSNENLVFSPFSIRAALAVFYQLAAGRTERDLQTVIGFNSNKTIAHQLVTSQIKSLTKSSEIRYLNKYYINKLDDLKVNSDFIRKIADYKSDIGKISFDDPQRAAQVINDFVSKAFGKTYTFRNLNFLPETSMLVVNSLDFQAPWYRHYSKEDVKKDEFIALNGISSQIDFINDAGYYYLYENDVVQVLQISYRIYSEYRFWIILPTATTNIMKVKSKINREFISNIYNEMVTQYVDVKFPVFELNFESSTVLQKLGLSSITNSSKLKIIKSSDSTSFIIDFRHKIKFNVKTNGTVPYNPYDHEDYMEPSRPGHVAEFTANRPFIFVVMLAEKLEPILVGHYAYPNRKLN